MPAREELPSTLRRSPKDAQETWVETHDSAVETYGEGQRAHRVAHASLKNKYEKVGDHWERKSGRRPSDRQAAGEGRPARGDPRRTAEGVNAEASRNHLYGLSRRRLDIPGPSQMSKGDLIKVIERANARRTAETQKR